MSSGSIEIAEYYTVSRGSGKVLGNLTGYNSLKDAIRWMNHLKKLHKDTVVITGECKIVAE